MNGYEKEPSLSSMLPKQKLPKLKGKVFNKKVDAVWRTNLPLVGEIRTQATNISSKLRPSFTDADDEDNEDEVE